MNEDAMRHAQTLRLPHGATAELRIIADPAPEVAAAWEQALEVIRAAPVPPRVRATARPCEVGGPSR